MWILDVYKAKRCKGIRVKITEPSVAVVTPIFNRVGNLKRFFDSLRSINYRNYTIIIVDDGSTDGSSEFIQQQYPQTVILKGDANLWWAGAMNKGIEWALQHKFDYVLTYNDDQLCDPEFLTELVKWAGEYPNAIMSSHVYYINEPKKLVSGGIRIDKSTRQTFGVHNERTVELPMVPYKVDCAPGYSLLISTSIIRAIGIFDNTRFPQIYMELEYCLRAADRGYEVVMVPSSKIWNDRDDKSEDAVRETNPYKRLIWHLTSYKSHLNYSQTKNLTDILFHDLPFFHSMSRSIFWVKYFIKLITVSLLSKNIRQSVKSILCLNTDRWA